MNLKKKKHHILIDLFSLYSLHKEYRESSNYHTMIYM